MIKKLLPLFLILFLNFSIVHAQDPESPVSGLKIMLPENLSGYSLLVRDASGAVLSESQIDTTGTAEIASIENASDILINTENISDSPERETVYSLNKLLIYLAATALVTATVFYFLGRRRAKVIINMLRDEVYEEDFD